MPVEDFIIYVYWCVDGAYREIIATPSKPWLFSKHTGNKLITMEIVGEFMG